MEKELLKTLADLAEYHEMLKVNADRFKKCLALYMIAKTCKQYELARKSLNSCFRIYEEVGSKLHSIISGFAEDDDIIDAYLDSGIEQQLKEWLEIMRREEKVLNELTRGLV